MAITSREGGKGLRKMMMMVVMKREREQQQWIAAYTLNLMTMSTRTNWLYCHIASLGQFGGYDNRYVYFQVTYSTWKGKGKKGKK